MTGHHIVSLVVGAACMVGGALLVKYRDVIARDNAQAAARAQGASSLLNRERVEREQATWRNPDAIRASALLTGGFGVVLIVGGVGAIVLGFA